MQWLKIIDGSTERRHTLARGERTADVDDAWLHVQAQVRRCICQDRHQTCRRRPKRTRIVSARLLQIIGDGDSSESLW